MTETVGIISEAQNKGGEPVKASIVADYILSLSNPDEGDLISNLKLQKLLYYCQGIHLALHNTKLFNEKIYHWEHGPVVEEIYHAMKKYGSEAIPVPADADFSSLSEAQKETINEVYDVYGQFSAWKLRQMTHEEDPWVNTKPNEEITAQMLTDFFKSKLIQ